MYLNWICRKCGEQIAGMLLGDDDPRVSALTEQAGEDIIEIDRSTMTIRILCEECLEALNMEEQSGFTFLQGPQLH